MQRATFHLNEPVDSVRERELSCGGLLLLLITIMMMLLMLLLALVLAQLRKRIPADAVSQVA